MAAEFVLNRDLRAVLTSPDVDLERARSLLDDAEAVRVQLDDEGLSYAFERALERLANVFREHPHDLERLEDWAELASLAATLPFDVNLWKSQNVFYDLLKTVYPAAAERAETEEVSARWVQIFDALGEQLSVAVP
jgi:hypothetical protein